MTPFEILPPDYNTVLAVRQKVLWPNEPLEFSKLPLDAVGQHCGAFRQGQCVGVISMFWDAGALQFRKFAVLPQYQQQGIGGALLVHVKREAGGAPVWCDARITAQGFYQRHGFDVQGLPFLKHGEPYVRMVFE
jgi:GNAT superfamily N-acetyltransferase